MRSQLLLLLCILLTLTSCEEEVTPVQVDLKVLLQTPLPPTPDNMFPSELAALLQPLRCEDKLQYLDVSLTIMRLDHEPVVSETIEVPLTWLNDWRKSSDTYTYANHLENYKGNGAAIPFPEILALKAGTSAGTADLSGGEFLYCCGAAPTGTSAIPEEVLLKDLPDHLARLSCEGTLKDRYTINYFLSTAQSSARAPSPLLSLPTAPAAAAPNGPTQQDKVSAAFNATGNRDTAPSERFAGIESYRSLFTEDAHVKIYGDKGTVVANQPVSEYLETISYYRTIDTIYVDKAALRKDSLCWEVHLREIHL